MRPDRRGRHREHHDGAATPSARSTTALSARKRTVCCCLIHEKALFVDALLRSGSERGSIGTPRGRRCCFFARAVLEFAKDGLLQHTLAVYERIFFFFASPAPRRAWKAAPTLDAFLACLVRVRREVAHEDREHAQGVRGEGEESRRAARRLVRVVLQRASGFSGVARLEPAALGPCISSHARAVISNSSEKSRRADVQERPAPQALEHKLRDRLAPPDKMPTTMSKGVTSVNASTTPTT